MYIMRTVAICMFSSIVFDSKSTHVSRKRCRNVALELVVFDYETPYLKS